LIKQSESSCLTGIAVVQGLSAASKGPMSVFDLLPTWLGLRLYMAHAEVWRLREPEALEVGASLLLAC
jgi:hypothetical protein